MLQKLGSINKLAPHLFVKGMVFFIYFFFNLTGLHAQVLKDIRWSLSLEPQQVFIYAHDEQVDNYKGSGGTAVAFHINRLRSDPNAVNYAGLRYNSGFGFQFVAFDSVSLGNSLNLSYFIEPLLVDKEFFQWRMKFAGGINFASKPYDKVSNNTNRAYSLPINGYLGLGTSLYFKLSQKSWLFANATYSHFSNGNTKNPNLGLNFPHLGIGLDYTLTQNQKPIGKTLFYKERWRYDIGFFGTNKSFPFYPDERFWAYGVLGQISYRSGNLHAWTLGAELFKDNSIQIAIDSNDEITNKDISTNLGGVLIGHEFLFNRFIFSQQLGYYIFNELPKESNFVGTFYHRWGFNYKLSRHVMLGLNLNANLQKAYLIDLRLVFSVFN
jgi:hypothetical protein